MTAVAELGGRPIKPLLSVVVPTHNRANYAASCIEAVLRLDAQDLELVVSDTSTDRRLFDFLHNDPRNFLGDARLKYRKIDQPSSLTQNHNDAVELAGGTYVCVIGDDDCITSAALKAAKWARDNDVPVVSQTVAANYAWPDFRSVLARSGHAGRLYVPRKVSAGKWRSTKSDLTAALARALQFTDGLPRCYHGIVRRDLLEEIRQQTGAYFHGSSPDMSGAVSLACLVDRYFEVETPLTIPGASGGSNSGRSAMNSHKGDLSSETQTSNFQHSGWTRGVPRFFSVETVWAHAGLESLARLRPDLVSSFNYPRLLALCGLRHPEFHAASEAAAKEVEAALGESIAPSISREMRAERWRRAKYLARRMAVPTAGNFRRYFAGLSNIAEASQRYELYAREKGIEFGDPPCV